MPPMISPSCRDGFARNCTHFNQPNPFLSPCFSASGGTVQPVTSWTVLRRKDRPTSHPMDGASPQAPSRQILMGRRFTARTVLLVTLWTALRRKYSPPVTLWTVLRGGDRPLSYCMDGSSSERKAGADGSKARSLDEGEGHWAPSPEDTGTQNGMAVGRARRAYRALGHNGALLREATAASTC